MTKEEEIAQVAEQLAKEEETLNELLRHSQIEQPLEGPADLGEAVAPEIEKNKAEVDRLRARLEKLRGT